MDIDLGLIAGLIGAGAWIPIIIEKLKKPKLIGSIENVHKMNIHESAIDNLPVFLKGESTSVYLVDFKLVILNSDFIAKKIDVKVKLRDLEKMEKGTLFYDTNIYYAIDKYGLKLDLKLVDTLIGKVRFVKDELSILTNTIYLDTKTQRDIEYIEIIMINYKDKKISSKLYLSETSKFINNLELSWQEKRIV